MHESICAEFACVLENLINFAKKSICVCICHFFYVILHAKLRTSIRMATKEKIYFLSFCVEAYKMRHGLAGEEVLRLFDKMGVTRYLTDHCEVLHTQSKDWIVDDIDEFIRIRT